MQQKASCYLLAIVIDADLFCTDIQVVQRSSMLMVTDHMNVLCAPSAIWKHTINLEQIS